MRPYSQNLRLRVVQAYENREGSMRQLAVRFRLELVAPFLGWTGGEPRLARSGPGGQPCHPAMPQPRQAAPHSAAKPA